MKNKLKITLFVLSGILLLGLSGFLIFSYLNPEKKFTISYFLHDASSSTYKINNNFIYDGLNIQAEFSSNKIEPKIENCEYLNKPSDYINWEYDSCNENNKSRKKESETNRLAIVKFNFQNKAKKYRDIKNIDMYFLNNKGEVWSICQECRKNSGTEIIPSSSIEYVIEQKLPKDQMFNFVIQAKGKAKQIITLE